MSTICLTLHIYRCRFSFFFFEAIHPPVLDIIEGGNYLQLWCTCGLGRDPALLIFSLARQGLVIFHGCLRLLIFSFFTRPCDALMSFPQLHQSFFCSTFLFALVFFFFSICVFSVHACLLFTGTSTLPFLNPSRSNADFLVSDSIEET